MPELLCDGWEFRIVRHENDVESVTESRASHATATVTLKITSKKKEFIFFVGNLNYSSGEKYKLVRKKN